MRWAALFFFPFKPFHLDGFSQACRSNKYGIVHFVFLGVAVPNFYKMMYGLSLKIVFI